MAARVSLKQQGKRPRSSTTTADTKGKKKQGTPEKSNTPLCDDFGQEGDGLRKPIINDEILALQIKPEDLFKLRAPRPPECRKTTPVFNTVLVKRPCQSSAPAKHKSVIVIRPAPPDSPVRIPNYPSFAGPRFDAYNSIVPHSILGDVDEFVAEAARHGDLSKLQTTCDSLEQPDASQVWATRHGRNRRKQARFPRFENVYNSNALRNWEVHMAERRRQQKYLSCLLDKPVDELVMNQSDEYRKTQELRYLIERTAPFIEKGDFEHIGTEFWAQPTNFGGELNGLQTTLTETQKGYPPAVLHIGVPRSILFEKGLSNACPAQECRKPWHKNPYLCERLVQLEPLMNELDPHEPEIEALEVVGTNKPQCLEVDLSSNGEHEPCDREMQISDRSLPSSTATSSDKDQCNQAALEPVVGPSVMFGGFTAKWAGDPHSCRTDVAIEARVNFETYAGERTMSFLEIGNNGTTTLYYDWKKMPKPNPFNIPTVVPQKFYFNQSNGVLLPGDLIKFPFVFKSPHAGVFSEQWQFETHPVVCNGAKLLVTLRGVALIQDTLECRRVELENELSQKETMQVVCSVLEEIMAGIKTPERARSPIDAYITDEELFRRENPTLHFSYDNYCELNKLYADALPEEMKLLPWDFHIETIREAIMAQTDYDLREQLLKRLSDILTSMSFAPFVASFVPFYSAGLTILSKTVDEFVQCDSELRSYLNLINPAMDPDAVVRSATSSASRKSRSASLRSRDGKSKGSKAKLDSKDKKSSRDLKPSPSTSKSKEQLSASRLQRSSTHVSPPADPGSNVLSVVVSVTRPPSQPADPSVPAADPPADDRTAVRNAYRSKLRLQTYMLLCDMANQMESVLDELHGKSPDSFCCCPSD